MKKHIFVFLLFCYSCNYDKKMDPVPEKTQEFTGIVLDYTTNQPISNADVLLYIPDSTKNNNGGGCLLTDHTYYDLNELNEFFSCFADKYSIVTNISGNFSIVLPFDDSKMNFYLFAYKNGYLILDNGLGDIRNLTGGTSFNDTIYLERASVLKTIFHHTQPISSNDTLKLMFRFFNSNDPGFPFPAIISSAINKYIFTSNGSCMFNDSVSFKKSDVVTVDWSINNNGLIAQGQTPVDTLVEFGTKQIDIIY